MWITPEFVHSTAAPCCFLHRWALPRVRE